MKNYTNEEIIEKAVELFNIEHKKHYYMGWEGADSITIGKNTNNIVEIKIDCMYGAPSPNLNVLMGLAEFFDTKNINDDDHFSFGGCESCDYGSHYGYTLTVRNED